MKENIQLLFTILLSVYIVCLTQCKQDYHNNHSSIPPPDTIITIDTVYPPPIYVELPQKPPPIPTIIYIDSSKTIVQKEQIDTSIHHAITSYKDSLSNDELTIYHESIVDGELLGNIIGYKLNVPRTIQKTIEVSKPYPTPVSAVFLTGGVGTNFQQFSSLNVGLQFISAKGWSVGYEYDILQNEHQAKIGIKLFQFKPKFKPQKQ